MSARWPVFAVVGTPATFVVGWATIDLDADMIAVTAPGGQDQHDTDRRRRGAGVGQVAAARAVSAGPTSRGPGSIERVIGDLQAR